MAAAAALLLCILPAGCGSGTSAARAPGAPVTVYMSLPSRGVSASVAADVAAGARLALADARGRAGGRPVRLMQLDSSRPGDQTWDPSQVESNAKRAAGDPATIAYIGELDTGASAISVPVTNDKQILQVSPLDGLTSLTRAEPGSTLANDPARYYPSGQRTFLRLVPTDYEQAATLVAWARAKGARRIALVQDERLDGRALAGQARYAAGRLGVVVTDVVEAKDEPSGYPDLARRLEAGRPDAVIYTGLGDAPAGALLGTIHRALPAAALYGGSALATAVPAPQGLPPTDVVKPALSASAYGPRARRVLGRLSKRRAAQPEALYGYEAMRLVLDAISAAGRSGNSAAVAHAALAPRLRESAVGPYRVSVAGDISTPRFGGWRRSSAGLEWLGARPVPPTALNRP